MTERTDAEKIQALREAVAGLLNALGDETGHSEYSKNGCAICEAMRYGAAALAATESKP